MKIRLSLIAALCTSHVSAMECLSEDDHVAFLGKVTHQLQTEVPCAHRKRLVVEEDRIKQTKDSLLKWDEAYKNGLLIDKELLGQSNQLYSQLKFNPYDLAYVDIEPKVEDFKSIPIAERLARVRTKAQSNDEVERTSITSLVSWFKGTDKNINEQDLVQEIARKKEEYRVQKKCPGEVMIAHHVTNHPLVTNVYERTSDKLASDKQKLEMMQEQIATLPPDYLATESAGLFQAYSGTAAVTSLEVCDERIPQLDMGEENTEVIKAIPPCATTVTKYFPDNKYKITGMTEDSPELVKLKACIKERMAIPGTKMVNVSISASSSSLDNTEEAEKDFGKKGFLDLSKNRALEAEKNILPMLGLAATAVKITPDFKGSNGDGTSGECPYVLKNGKEEILPEYEKGGKRRAELDKAKFVKIEVHFTRQDAGGNSLSQITLNKKCKAIKFECIGPNPDLGRMSENKP